ncbi:MAG: hypothetical protein H6Q36_1355 [Chloroflexi bacterium]|nr:hypothetical protein [Chloroflexota bacterium]
MELGRHPVQPTAPAAARTAQQHLIDAAIHERQVCGDQCPLCRAVDQYQSAADMPAVIAAEEHIVDAAVEKKWLHRQTEPGHWCPLCLAVDAYSDAMARLSEDSSGIALGARST